jgi:predicted aspartyl protease
MRLKVAAIGLAAAVGTPAAAQDCNMALAAEMPVEMHGPLPLVRVGINGQPVLALLDTGAFKTMIWRGAAERMGLRMQPVEGMKLVGVGGAQDAQVVKLAELSLGASKVKDAPILVGGRSEAFAGREDVALILGQDVLTRADLEIDLKNRVVRLFTTEGCKGKPLVYWTPHYQVADLYPLGREWDRDIELDVRVNGKTVRAIMDTGASTTVMTTAAARRAGVPVGSDATAADSRARGIGAKTVQNWSAVFDTIEIGDETVKKARVKVADLFRHSRSAETGSRIGRESTETEMLLGADFFMAHRVFIAYSQNKAFFSYNGGPIFRAPKPDEAP